MSAARPGAVSAGLVAAYMPATIVLAALVLVVLLAPGSCGRLARPVDSPQDLHGFYGMLLVAYQAAMTVAIWPWSPRPCGVQHVSGRGLLAVGFDHRTSRVG